MHPNFSRTHFNVQCSGRAEIGNRAVVTMTPTTQGNSNIWYKMVAVWPVETFTILFAGKGGLV